jgi:hypothetical protein
MGTVIPRKRADGSTGYQAQLLIKRSGKVIHREVRTFDRKQAASAWLEKREKELAKPGALDRLQAPDPTLAAVINRYTNESIKKIGRTKAQVLRAIKSHDIANKKCSEITSTDVIAFANLLVIKISPQTVANYLSHFGRGIRCRETSVGISARSDGYERRICCCEASWHREQEPRT